MSGEVRRLRFHYLSTENGLPRNSACSITEDKYGFIWIATIDGLCRFDGYKVKIYSAIPGNSKSPVNNRPKKIIRDRQGNIWSSFSSDSRFCRYNYLSDDFTPYQKTSVPDYIKAFLDKPDNSSGTAENSEFQWRVDVNGLIQINKKTQEHIIYRFDQNSDYGLKDAMVGELFLDSRNTLWLATNAGGVCYADVNQPGFKSYFNKGSFPGKLPETTIRAVFQEENGNLWLGTRKSGLVRVRKGDRDFTIFRHDPQNSNTIIQNEIRKIYKDAKGELWIGTKGGLERLNTAGNGFKHYPAMDRRSATNWIYAIEEDNRGNLWIGTWMAGVARYDRGKDKFISYPQLKASRFNYIRSLLREGNSCLWVGTEGHGLFLMRRSIDKGREKLSFISYHYNPQSENSITDDRVYCLCKDNDGFLWIGTGRGLNRFDPQTGRFIHFPDKRFISSGVITGILNDGHGNLWISHPYGLTRMNYKTFRTSDYSSQDDLFRNELSEDAYFRNPKTGECFFGGNFGIITFFPDSVKDNLCPPNAVITDLLIAGKSVAVGQSIHGHVVLPQPVYLSKSVMLKWSERNVELEFAALHFTNVRNNSYAYRLTGFDKEWKNADANNRKALYTNLPAGKYLFEVKAANSNGIWQQSSTTLQIIVLPPWWQTWWAYLFYLLIVSGIFYLLHRMLVSREKLKHQIQIERLNADKARELEVLKSKFFTNISHELRTPLTLILDPVKKLVAEKESFTSSTRYFHELIYENAKRLLSLVNQLLDLKKVESGEMKLQYSRFDLNERIRNLISLFELQANERGIDLHLISDGNLIELEADADMLDKIVLNLLSNAFKFTPDKGSVLLKVAYSTDNQFVQISVQDSGQGIAPSDMDKIFNPFYQADSSEQKYGTGIGLSLVKELVEMHNGSIRVESIVGQGTSFHITLPISANTLRLTEVKREQQNLELSTVQSVTLSEDNSDENIVDNAKPVIVIVEDNSEVREYLRTVLSEHFNVHDAVNGVRGYELTLELIPDLVVSDMMMPEMDGIELCARLKTEIKTSHIPVVLLTARYSEQLRISSFETGADDYITKPFNSAILIARIRNLIESRQKLRQLFDKNTGYNTRVIGVNQVDKQFLEELVNHIHDNMSRISFDVEELASMMSMSRIQLNRKIKSLTDKTAQEFVLTVRLSKAAEFLLSGTYNVSEVSDMVGYSEVSSFTRSFTRQFGESPTSYIVSHSV
ncbi:two-component regulator propeller domain-containing protein [Parabacteroides sp. FAFU027]|uniref:hybrid sensor histidine kinase/response regulator transcription factor n=1 Tax=Parabacteroides sp. FAFU027 TaxID=2922715 RepID=UPI001FB01843|nr:two-component regulator propeller domain-containing protein [Parabacteroides sp. FAFU027]